MPLTQAQINVAVRRMLDGDDGEALQLIREGVVNGEIIVQTGETGVHLRATPPDSPMARALTELRAAGGNPMNTAIAESVGVSEATISRLFNGNRLGNWPTVRLVIEYLGGDPADYRPLWDKIKSRHPQQARDETSSQPPG